MRLRFASTTGLISLIATPVLVLIGCGGVTDIDFQGPDASVGGTSGAGGAIIGGGTGGGITDGGSGNFGGSGNIGGVGGGDGGVGNMGGTGNVGGTGPVVCGGVTCPPPSVPIGQVESCCVGTKCGISSSLIGNTCVELNQAGKPDPTCPPQSIQGITLNGCCKPNGMCGVLDTFIGVGCVDPTQFGVGTPTKCGGTGTGGAGGTGGTTATGGTGGTTATGGTGGITDASVGGTGGVSADGGIPGEVYCDNNPSTIVCSASQNCCLLNPGAEYCSPKGTPCACTGTNCDATTVSCDGNEDCATGQVCCGTFSQQANAYTTLKCQATCGGQWEREICKPNGKCTNPGQTCSQSNFLTSYIWRCN